VLLRRQILQSPRLAPVPVLRVIRRRRLLVRAPVLHRRIVASGQELRQILRGQALVRQTPLAQELRPQTDPPEQELEHRMLLVQQQETQTRQGQELETQTHRILPVLVQHLAAPSYLCFLTCNPRVVTPQDSCFHIEA